MYELKSKNKIMNWKFGNCIYFHHATLIKEMNSRQQPIQSYTYKYTHIYMHIHKYITISHSQKPADLKFWPPFFIYSHTNTHIQHFAFIHYLFLLITCLYSSVSSFYFCFRSFTLSTPVTGNLLGVIKVENLFFKFLNIWNKKACFLF